MPTQRRRSPDRDDVLNASIMRARSSHRQAEGAREIAGRRNSASIPGTAAISAARSTAPTLSICTNDGGALVGRSAM